ncbi:secretory lipase-domain-containing protein [Halenospora varia]|nr:secretory lipase-domain-containing protein [Halenospora varia]
MFCKLKLFQTAILGLSCAVPTLGSPFHSPDIETNHASTPLPPSQDPWYTAPKQFEAAPPGAILRIRPAPGNLSTITANCSSAYNILYRTIDSRYLPSWAVTTLYIPTYPTTSKTTSHNNIGTSLLSYQFPYNSVDVDSSPSYSFYSGVLTDVTFALGNGWHVSVPDFEGPHASNVAGILEAHSTLDSIRGSIPSEWALEFQEQYAPELNISGAALGGLVPNVTAVIESVGGTIWASHAISGFLGILSQYPDAYAYLLSQLKTSGPYNATRFLEINKMSYPEAHIAYTNQSLFNYFPQGAAILQHPLIKTALQKNAVMTYHGVPSAPIFVYKAVNDEVTLVGDSDAYVERSCRMGARGRALEWLGGVFEGRAGLTGGDSGCEVVNVTVGVVDTGL